MRPWARIGLCFEEWLYDRSDRWANGKSMQASARGTGFSIWVRRVLVGESLLAGVCFLVFFQALALAQQGPVPVFVREVTQQHFVEYQEALGTLRANEAVTLSATVTETISAIHFEDGQRVKAGDILVEMTRAEERALLEEARSTMEETRRQYDRVVSLVKQKLAPESQLDERRSSHETAAARYQAIQSRLQDRLIVAPFDGVVGLRNVSLGALVEPGDPITTLDDDSVMKLDFTVPATYLNALAPGMAIQARARALGNKLFEGVVSSVGFRVDPVTRSVRVRAVLPNREKRLRPGILMSVKLQQKPRLALMIPEQAVIAEGTNSFVLVVEQSDNPATAVRRQIVLGARRLGEVEVTAGLRSGELVVTHGAVRIRPGSPVVISAIEHGSESLEELLQQIQVPR